MGRAEDIFQRIVEHGEDEIDGFIETRKSEELFLDFKRSADSGSGRRLHDHDRKNLAKAISGFGNSEGGVVVWGVDCSKDEDYADVAHAKFPIQHVERFTSWLEGAVSGCTIPPHIGVQHHPITRNTKGDGFVATYIPKSFHAPHQAVGRYQYFIRAGSSFAPTPHAVLAGMFGRRPQPHVYHLFVPSPAKLIVNQIKVQMAFEIRNDGPGIASDLFTSIEALSIPGDNCKLTTGSADPTDWVDRASLGRWASVISQPHIRIPPGSQIKALTMDLSFAPPFSKGLRIGGICGCGQSPPYRFKIQKDAISIEKLYEDFVKKTRSCSATTQDGYDLVKAIWNVESERTY